MTTTPLAFQLDRVKSTVRLFGLTQPITANSLASNVNFVEWDGGTGIGKIIFNDRIPLPEEFADPSPYQTYINQWMTGASAEALPLTLAQAQAVKLSLLKSIFLIQSEAPVSVATSLGTFIFNVNPTDPASVQNNNNVMSALAAVNADVAAAIAALVSSINSNVVGGVNGNVVAGVNNNVVAGVNNELNVAAGDVNALAGIINANAAAGNTIVQAGEDALGEGLTSPYTTVAGAGFGGGVGGIAGISGVAASYTGPTALSGVTLSPIGATSFQAFTVADLFAVLLAAQEQINATTLALGVKTAAVNALTTISSVIAYDATTGW